MAMLRELKEFRNTINKKLCCDQEIVDLINDKANSPLPGRDLLYKQIFPYAYTPDAVKDTGTFICHRIHIPEVANKTFKNVTIMFYIFVHQDNIRTSNGLRYDLIGERIEELFNGIMDLGVGRMNLVEVGDISPSPKFHGISMEYTVLELNRPTINGNPRAGAKRMIQKPNLLRVSEYRINDKIAVHVPTVDEIFEFGDQKYYSIVQSLISTPFDLMVELDDIGIDFETITNYQLFMLMLESIAANESDTSILFGSLNLKDFREADNLKTGERILWNKKDDIIIDRMIALEICNVIRKIHFWEAPIGQAGNAEAKRYLIERNRLKKQRLAKKPYKSFLESMIISLVNTEEFPYNYETVMGLSVYKLNASWRQIQKKKHWEQTMNGCYFGTVDINKIDLEKISWLSPEQ